MCPITSTHLLRDTQGEEDEDHRHQEFDRSLEMSLQDVVDPPPPRPSPSSPPPPPPEQLCDTISNSLIDDISIPISAQLFELYDSDFFPDNLQNSEVTSSPNCCSYEDQNSSYTTNISFPSSIADNTTDTKNNTFNTEKFDIHNFQGDPNDQNGNNSTTSSTTTTATTITAPRQQQSQHSNNGLQVIYDPQVEIDNDISASIDFSPSPPFNTPTLPYNINPTTLTDHVAISNGLTQYPTNPVDPTISLPLITGPSLGLGPVFDDHCLSSLPPFLRLNHSAAAAAAAVAAAAAAAVSSSSSCTFLDPPTIANFPPANLTAGLCADNSSIFGGNLMLSTELHPKELDFQGDNASIFCTDQLPRYNSGDIQLNCKAFSNENSQLVNGSTSSTPIGTEISSLDDSTYKVGKLSVEQRKEKIHRYMKKRNERNFSKKIKYACRKTLADSRPRVRGRFAKNDEFGESHKHLNGNHEDDDYDEVAVKDEDDMVDSDIFAHISGVNSFKCNYQIQSWI